MSLNLGSFGALNRLTGISSKGALVSTELQNPTPGLDQNRYFTEIARTPSTIGAGGIITRASNERTAQAEDGRARDEFELRRELARRDVASTFGDARQRLQASLHRRGVGRSGFAAEAMSRLGAQEAGALAEVEAGLTESLMRFKQEQEAIRLQEQAIRRARAKRRQGKRVGGALALAGLALAPLTGGLSLGLTGAGAQMALA